MKPFATTLAPWQAVGLWAELEDALQGRASHGHDAEIYAYRLLPALPTADQAVRNARFADTTTGRESLEEALLLVENAMDGMLEVFAEIREAKCTVLDEINLHRFKIRVEPRR